MEVIMQNDFNNKNTNRMKGKISYLNGKFNNGKLKRKEEKRLEDGKQKIINGSKEISMSIFGVIKLGCDWDDEDEECILVEDIHYIIISNYCVGEKKGRLMPTFFICCNYLFLFFFL